VRISSEAVTVVVLTATLPVVEVVVVAAGASSFLLAWG
jgi:hypothetical protein